MIDSHEMHEAVAGLYSAFSSYGLPEFTNPCLCCHTLEDEARLHSKPLRELDPDDLRQYAEDALLVWGGETEFKHFLPRICELFIRNTQGEFIYAPHILFARFRYGNWHAWPEREQMAVRGFLRAIWNAFLGDPPDADEMCEPFQEPEDAVCSIAQCEDDLSPYLAEWIKDERPSASLALSSFILTSRMCTHGVPVTDSFWGKRGAQYAQVQAWLRSGAVEEKLLRAEEQTADSDLKREFSAARSACSSAT